MNEWRSQSHNSIRKLLLGNVQIIRFGDLPRIGLNARWEYVLSIIKKKKYKGEYAMCVTFPSGNAMNKPKANVLVGT